ncbi:MAG: hypothetical protein K2G03_01815, partial [Bacilli bacterium]|nr:hypothetical protein [Bacilli bacterium]
KMIEKSPSKSFLSNDDSIKNLLSEIRIEQKVSPSRKDEEFESYIKQGIFDIEEIVGTFINFDQDLKARALLKEYVLFSDFKMLKDFKERYADDYFYLQAKYSRDTNL